MSEKTFTEYQKQLYRKTFQALNDTGFWSEALKTGLPFSINQDPAIGAYNTGFYMWQAGREHTIDDMLALCEGTNSVDQIKERLKQLRRMELDQDGLMAHQVEERLDLVQ